MAESQSVSPEAISPELLEKHGAMKDLRAPKGAFDPAGAWRASYRMYMVQNRGDYRGMLTIEKSAPSGADAFVLTCDHRSLQQPQGLVHSIQAKITCRNDALASPTRAEIHSRVYAPTDTQEWKAMALDKSWKLAAGGIEQTDAGRPRRIPIAGAFTGSWNLFDVVQRFPANAPKPLEFDLLDGMDKLKVGHRLRYRETTTIPYAGAEVKVDCFSQLGHGQLPMVYYVDRTTRRCLLVISGRRCYVLDEGAKAYHDEQMQPYVRKGARWLA